MSRNLLAVSVMTLSAALVYASTPTATAQSTATPECTHIDTFKARKSMARIIAEHTAAGRENMMLVPLGDLTYICGW